MASKRNLKKDVNYVASEIINECFTLDYLFPDKNKEVYTELIADTILFRNNTIKAINNVKNTVSEPIKNQFKNIHIKMRAEIIELVGRLEKLN